jgi:hypothetical protein
MHMARMSHETVSGRSSRSTLAESSAVDLLALSRISGLGNEGVARVLGQLARDQKSPGSFFELNRQELRERFELRARAAEWVEKHADKAREEAPVCYGRARELRSRSCLPLTPAIRKACESSLTAIRLSCMRTATLSCWPAGEWRS